MLIHGVLPMVEDFIPVPPRLGCDKNSAEYKNWLKRMEAFNKQQDLRAQKTFFYALRGLFRKLVKRRTG